MVSCVAPISRSPPPAKPPKVWLTASEISKVALLAILTWLLSDRLPVSVRTKRPPATVVEPVKVFSASRNRVPNAPLPLTVIPPAALPSEITPVMMALLPSFWFSTTLRPRSAPLRIISLVKSTWLSEVLEPKSRLPPRGKKAPCPTVRGIPADRATVRSSPNAAKPPEPEKPTEPTLKPTVRSNTPEVSSVPPAILIRLPTLMPWPSSALRTPPARLVSPVKVLAPLNSTRPLLMVMPPPAPSPLVAVEKLATLSSAMVPLKI